MIEIPISKGYIAIVDDCDSDLLERKWNACISRNEYIYASTGTGKNRFMHRIILGRILGRQMERHELVDHINGNRLDNQRNNLRLANQSQNSQNQRRRTDNTSGYKGVHVIKLVSGVRYDAIIWINRKCIYIGRFRTIEDAYFAYCEAAKKYHGEFARLE